MILFLFHVFAFYLFIIKFTYRICFCSIGFVRFCFGVC
ncbi:hypothetical protein [Azospirillum argentinense]